MATPSAPSAEIQAAVSYLISHLSAISLSPAEQASLVASLAASLSLKYDSHWHPSDPERGSAYRAVTRTSSSLDDELVKAISQCTSIKPQAAAKALATSMGSDKWTLWIDPGCVSIRMHGNGTHFSTSSSSLDYSPSSNKVNMSGILEIWGKLPSTVSGGAPVQPATVTRPKTPAAKRKQSMLRLNEEANIAAEFEALALNASPATKKSKAIAIMRPAAIHKGITSITSLESVAATPPRPLPPLSFTIQESTSPYVPSFATAFAPLGQADNASTSSSGNTVTRTPTPSLLGHLVSQPLATSDSASSSSASSPSCASASDPFARPSSRSSTTSLNSATSCSIFSHASSDSRSSSIGSFTTEEASDKECNTTITSLNVVKASQGEMEAAKSFTFPSSNMLKADTLAMLPQSSAPNSPSKSRRRHDRSASIVSASSSHSHASYTRRPSSRAEVVVDKEIASKPQEYSNGKVGVLGGGVMLGPKKDGSSSTGGHKRNHSTASSNGTTLNVTRNTSRPPKVRTTSSGSSTSNGSNSDYHHQQTLYNNNNQFYQHYPTHTQQQQQQAGQGYNNNWAHYPAPPTHIPQQYRY